MVRFVKQDDMLYAGSPNHDDGYTVDDCYGLPMPDELQATLLDDYTVTVATDHGITEEHRATAWAVGDDQWLWQHHAVGDCHVQSGEDVAVLLPAGEQAAHIHQAQLNEDMGAITVKLTKHPHHLV